MKTIYKDTPSPWEVIPCSMRKTKLLVPSISYKKKCSNFYCLLLLVEEQRGTPRESTLILFHTSSLEFDFSWQI